MKKISRIIREQSTWIIIGGLVGLVTLYLTYRQVELSRRISAANFLLELDKRLESEEYRKIRKNFCQDLIQSKFQFTWELYDASSADKIYGLFELIGLLEQEKVIGLKEIDALFSDYLDGYYEMGERYGLFKDQDKYFLSEFRSLVMKLRKMQKHYEKWTDKEVQDLVEAEAKMETF